MSLTIRRAVAADAAALSVFGAARFTETFGHTYAPENLAAFLAARFTPERQHAEITDPDALMLVACGGHFVGGYLYAAPVDLPIEIADPAAVQINRVYVHPDHHGGGAARGLMDAALDWARERGTQELYLTVAPDNARAIAFYRRYGFEIVGAYAFIVGDHVDDDRIMRAVIG
jgi:ribosomal protein S18 acetylase RimI-like enzyme